MGRRKVALPMDFPQQRDLKKLIERVEAMQVRGKAASTIKARIREILFDICVDLPMDIIASKYGVGERSMWRFFTERLGVSKSQIQAWCKEDEELRRKSKLEKLELRRIREKIIPTTIDELAKVLRGIDELRARVSTSTLRRYLSTILDLVAFTGKHPEDITSEDVKNFVYYLLIKAKEEGEDVNDRAFKSRFSGQVITPLRVFCDLYGIPKPAVLRTTEYQGLFKTVRITPRERYLILKKVYETFSDYEYVKGILFLLYYNGHRRSELTTMQWEEQEHFVIIYTKGKKGLRYTKLLPKYVLPEVIEVLENPPTSSFLASLGPKLKKILLETLHKGSISWRYVHDLGKYYHVWRHTACNDLIDYSDYNLSLIMNVLGWKQPRMIIQVYGEATPSQIARMMGWIKAPRRPFDYLINQFTTISKEEALGTEYEDMLRDKDFLIIFKDEDRFLDKALDEGLVGKEYARGVKANLRRIIKEFVADVGEDRVEVLLEK